MVRVGSVAATAGDLVNDATRPTLALGAAGALVAGTAWWGQRLIDQGVRLSADAAPFHGRWRWLEWMQLAPAFGFAVVLVAVWPSMADRLRWVGVVLASVATSFVWAVELAITPGGDRLWGPLTSRFEYLPLARGIDDLGSFVDTYVEQLSSYPTHVRGHPPAPVIGFWVLDQLGISDLGIGLVVFAAAASTTAAVLIAVRRLSDEVTARRIAPFVGFLPAVVWWSSADAVFMAAAAWATCLVVVALTTEDRRAQLAAGATGGLLAGGLVVSSYGAPTLLAPLGVIVLWGGRQRVWTPIAAAATAAVMPVAALLAAGFWWWDGFAATRREYWLGAASFRPLSYFVVANLAVTVVAVGPAVLAGATRAVRERVWLLPLGALIGTIAADLSGYSKGEVERIWLPLFPWLAVAAVGLRPGPRGTRVWLAAQLGVGLWLQAALGTPW